VNHFATTLAELSIGESAILSDFLLPDDISHRLMQMGMIPGCAVLAAHQAPAGDPVVYRVDGTEIALRRETSSRIRILPLPEATNPQLKHQLLMAGSYSRP
jgi:Fe2+ transport system protein FeoA